jgi:gluconolactonase
MKSRERVQRLALTDFREVGSGIRRPEGICVDREGMVWAADRDTFLACVRPDGTTVRYGEGGEMPNGLAVEESGNILIAEYEHGALKRFDRRTKAISTLLTEVEGRKTARANYPAVDRQGRIWCTSSTNWSDDLAALREKVDDGFVFVLEPGGSSRIVVEGLHFANGLAFSPDFKWLYIVESSTRRIVRVPVLEGGKAGPVQNFGPVLDATPDGIAFDQDENVWITLLLEKSALVVLDRSSDLHTVIEDPGGTILGGPTNVSFGGADMRDLYVGSLDRQCGLHARVEIPGVPLPGQSCGAYPS